MRRVSDNGEINDFVMLWRRPGAKDARSIQRNQAMSTKYSAVAVFHTHPKAHATVRELERIGFDMTELSIVGRDDHTDEHVAGYYNAGDRMKYWGKTGAVWGGFWSMLFGSAFFAIPGSWPLACCRAARRVDYRSG